jgi:hypothetical protein
LFTIHTNGVLKKTVESLNKDLLPIHKPLVNWDKVKADLEELSKPQLDLVLNLIKHMKTVNKEESHKDQS